LTTEWPKPVPLFPVLPPVTSILTTREVISPRSIALVSILPPVEGYFRMEERPAKTLCIFSSSINPLKLSPSKKLPPVPAIGMKTSLFSRREFVA
jgi:hypothetical protein